MCREEKRQLHDILNIMTGSMSKTKKAHLPAIYPLKGEHRKPEHVKTPPVVEQVVEEHADQSEPVGPIDSDVAELTNLQEVPVQVIPPIVHDQPSMEYSVNKPEVYTSKMIW